MPETAAEMTPKSNENPFFNLIFNVILPVIILNQVSKRAGVNGPTIALVIALAIPFSYGAYELIKNKRRNWLSLFGLVNVAVTGSLALLEFEGSWFALKEAVFPLLIGIGVLVSQIMGAPFFKKLFWNPAVFDIGKIDQRLAERQSDPRLIDRLFARGNLVFALSFFISGTANFFLAHRIFTKIDGTLAPEARKALLNEQIARMTMQGYAMIALPLMFLMMGLIFYLVRELRNLTGLTTEEIFKDQASS
jgi:hypothetical protein